MKLFRITWMVLLIGLLGMFWVFPQPFLIAHAKYFTFQKHTDKLYSSVPLSAQKKRLLDKYYQKASSRISRFWGDKQGTASVFYCDQTDTYNQLCQSPKGSGCSIITPFGSWIVLNPNGMNTDVIAHEMCHDELASRMGWWKTKTQLPKWLDEGLALQLDHRFVSSTDSIQRFFDYKTELRRFSMNNQVSIPLENLQTEEDFFGGDAVYTQLAYLTSATEVAKMISVSGRESVVQKTLNGDYEF